MATVNRFEQGWMHQPEKIKSAMLLSHGAGVN
jgi:hypothetical protein